MLHVRLDRILQRLRLRPADALDLLFVLPLHLQASARGRTRVSWDAAAGHTGERSRDAAGGVASALRPSIASASCGARGVRSGQERRARSGMTAAHARPGCASACQRPGCCRPSPAHDPKGTQQPVGNHRACGGACFTSWVASAMHTLRKVTLLYCSLNSSNLGAMILQGPHHEVE